MADNSMNPQTGGTENQKIKMNFGGADIEATVDKDGRIIMPEEVQNIMAAGMAVMKQAGQETEKTDLTNGDPTGKPVQLKENPADKFKGLPMRELIGGPLFAAAEAQEKLASIAWDYYQKIAYDGEGNTKKTRLLEFTLDRPVVQDGVVSDSNNKVTVKAPFIGLVPIPSLLIDRVDIDFQMEVTDTNSTTDRASTEASMDISSKWFGVNVGISGKVSSSRENTRSTNQTAKYQVHVTASQQPRTEGLAKLMDIMAACIEPVPTETQK